MACETLGEIIGAGEQPDPLPFADIAGSMPDEIIVQVRSAATYQDLFHRKVQESAQDGS